MPQLLAAFRRVLSKGKFVLSEVLDEFESEFARFCGTRHAVGVNSGTDALVLALKVVGIQPGDEVITVPNSYLASASAIALAGGYRSICGCRFRHEHGSQSAFPRHHVENSGHHTGSSDRPPRADGGNP